MGDLGGVLVLAGIAGLYFFTLKNAAGNLVYQPGNVTGFDLNGAYPVITADLIIQNTSNVDFTINSLAGNVTSDSTLIGNVSDFTPVQIRANSQGSIPLTLTLQPLQIVNTLIALLTGSGSGSRTMVITGSANVNGFQQAFTLSYKVGV